MKIFRMFYDFDKEETWLNRQVGDGWLVSKVGFRYTFAPIEPGAVVVRIDYRPRMSATDFDDYRNLFWDAGWQHIAGSASSGNQYFAASSNDLSVDIFSDASSKAQRYWRAMAMNAALLLPLMVIAVVLMSQGGLFDDVYLTPDLWQMQGWQFVRAFAFETPFAVLRVAGPLLLLVSASLLGVVTIYQWILYRRAIALTRI